MTEKTFEELFPELIKENISINWNYQQYEKGDKEIYRNSTPKLFCAKDIKKHCLSRQRVNEIIFKTYQLLYENIDNLNHNSVRTKFVHLLKKELGLE